MKWYGLLGRTISPRIFQRLSSTYFTWSILEYLDMVSSPPWRQGDSFFRASAGLPFHIDNGATPSYGGVTNRDFPGRTPASISCPIAKSVKVNLTNCHKEVCIIKFYQIVTSDVLASLSLLDKMLFWYVLGHGTCFYLLSTLVELQRELGIFWNVKPSPIQWFYRLSKNLFCCSSVL